MKSLKELYRFGMGPSSSHTMGPRNAAQMFSKQYPEADAFTVECFGSLSDTGLGHMTDKAIIAGLGSEKVTIVWRDYALPYHPNGMKFSAYDTHETMLGEWTVFSVGGGALLEEGQEQQHDHDVYPLQSMQDILAWADSSGNPLWKYVPECEGDDIMEFLEEMWVNMVTAIRRGLSEGGALPGGLKLKRRARSMLAQARRLKEADARTGILAAYALAVAEENAAGGEVVTAPTCGACGIVPAVMYYLHHDHGHRKESIVKGLATAGIIGNLAKHNASISGAEVGCQGEVGVACAMAASGVAEVLGGSPFQVEYSAETGLEHHLGLTCDPVRGLVQIPCIERNAFAAIRAFTSAEFALLTDGRHYVSYDDVVETMRTTGHDLPSLYRETSHGGLAKVIRG